MEVSVPSKKAKKESPSEIIEAYQLEMIEKLKKEGHGNATADTDTDGEVDDDRFNVLFSTVRALIGTNNEIWERCLPHKKEGPVKDTLRFYRLAYPTVKAVKGAPSTNMHFSTCLELEVEDFAAFPCLPSILSNIVPFEKDTNGSFTKYGDFMIKISYMAKSLAYHSFSILKDHLEDIQVALGKIETWITGSEDGKNFINRKFGSNLEIPELGDAATSDGRYFASSSICVKCFQRKDEHNTYYYPYSCPNQGNRAFGSFLLAYDVPLKTVPSTTLGSMDVSFLKVSSDADQELFTQFTELVQSKNVIERKIEMLLCRFVTTEKED